MESISIDNQRYTLLGIQRGGASVYRGDAGAYLRLGKPESIARDLGLHRAMVHAKYPVAPIISEGELGNLSYFVEKSLGSRSFRVVFQEDIDTVRAISKPHFDAFTAVMKKLYVAQVRVSENDWHVEEFAEGIKLPLLCRELPQHASLLRKRFSEACDRLQELKGTLTHGDCNPANIYEGGIIDLEDSFHAPLGYDIVSALISIEWSPKTREFEFFAQYRFSHEQREQYLRQFDVLAKRMKMPKLSRYLDDLAFCRAVWLCSGMHKWSRIQQWRYEKLITEYLSA